MSSALVLGKFYPPHMGHVGLIEAALKHRDRVVVLCAGSKGDSLSCESRLTALVEDAAAVGIDPTRLVGQTVYDEAPFDLDDPQVWQSHVEVFQASIARLDPVDLVVTSEPYGEELARRMGIEHAAFDPPRAMIPVSATQIRANPVEFWNLLGPGTRRMLAVRIVIVGAESTGTTTIAERLATTLRERGGSWSQVRLVTEYGRELTERKQRAARNEEGIVPLSVPWDEDDFDEVARRQTEIEEEAAASGGPVLVCDTDALATTVWERRYLGASRARLDPSTLGRGDVYLVTHHEGVPFVQDGTRDGAHIREAMTQEFTELLVEQQRPLAVLTGSLDDRLRLSLRITDQAVEQRLAFKTPI